MGKKGIADGSKYIGWLVIAAADCWGYFSAASHAKRTPTQKKKKKNFAFVGE
jgi:hypothetical protein